MLSELVKNKHVIGLKQTTKAVKNSTAKVVYIAQDAESHVKDPLFQLCTEHSTQVVWVPSMKEMGQALKIEVNTAAAAILL
ncbi:MAG: ribosomal L7Ae/L30e/S12e/Gadd45 family protein [Clostridia bacterium]|nr:ribosomal L7Ae/L30e/S12e/Gadd45 family protein [Clostridia bacterium]